MFELFRVKLNLIKFNKIFRYLSFLLVYKLDQNCDFVLDVFTNKKYEL